MTMAKGTPTSTPIIDPRSLPGLDAAVGDAVAADVVDVSILDEDAVVAVEVLDAGVVDDSESAVVEDDSNLWTVAIGNGFNVVVELVPQQF